MKGHEGKLLDIFSFSKVKAPNGFVADKLKKIAAHIIFPSNV